MIGIGKLASGVVGIALAALLLVEQATAQAAYPTLPIKLVFPFAAGGPGDVVARVLAEKVSLDLGQPVVVDNRTGADGAIGMQAAIRSRPDGYTLLMISAANISLPLLRENVYDWERGLTPVAGVGSVPFVIATNAKSGIRVLSDLAALAKTAPGNINYGSGGAGSPSHLASARLVGDLKIGATHVPFRGLNGAIQALLGEQVEFVAATAVDVIPTARSGHVRVLAVASEQRLPDLPDVPTMAELGFADFYFSTWYAFLVPSGTPGVIVDRLYGAIAKAADDPAVQERLGKLGLRMKTMGGADLGKFMRDESARLRRVIQQHQIKLEN